MAMPLANENVAPQPPAFVNVISLFLSTPVPEADQTLASAAKSPVTIASPAQVANSMIRSMLGRFSASSVARTLSLPVVADAQKQLETPATAPPQIDDSVIQSIVSSLTSQTASPSPAPTAAPPVATDARKQFRSVSDMPVLAAMAALAPMPTTFAAPMPPQSSPDGSGPSAAVTSAPQLPAPGPSMASPAKGEIAFTAVLTPMKETTVLAVTAGASRLAVDSPEKVSTPVATIPGTTTSSPSPTPAALSVQSQTAVAASGKESDGAQTGGDAPQGGDTSSQQQGDSTGTPARATTVADTKVKPTDGKQDDSGVTVAILDRAPVADASLTSFPEQARAAVATQLSTPAAAPTPFQSTAEAIRTSESDQPAAPQSRASAAQEISIRVAQPDSSPIDLRVVERSGQLHVDVRTSDAAMQTSLRQDLGTLTNSLQRAGYHSETFTPSSMLGRAASNAQMSNQDEHQDSSQNRGGSGEFSGGRRQPQQQKRPNAWLEEMEDQQ
jgi:hypothetical protein